MANRTYALVGRKGDLNGRYLSNQWPRMKEDAWKHYQNGDHFLQVWTAMQNGGLLAYDAEATRRITDFICKRRASITKFHRNNSGE